MVGSNEAPRTVTITRSWQVAFMAALVLSQIAMVGTMLWAFTRHGMYLSAGSWVWQVSGWVYPLLYVAAAYAFILRRVRGLVPRLFWSVFIATIGYVLYTALALVMNYVRVNLFSSTYSPGDAGLWAAFGWEWSTMAVVFALFCASLLAIRLRKRA